MSLFQYPVKVYILFILKNIERVLRNCFIAAVSDIAERDAHC